MSDELKAAAQSLWEQILQYSQGPMPTSPELARDSVGRAMEIIRQTVVVLGAYLSAREGDELPVTEEWLRSIGFEIISIRALGIGDPIVCEYWPHNDSWYVGTGREIIPACMKPKTRQQVRDLLAALGISTKEPQ